jgi:tRNA A-37 threonylcarbamoyl transferase component Bud32
LLNSTLLDTYKVKRLMAEGGMGRIYEAYHTRITEKRFAIKVLRPEFVNSPQIRARFEREMQAVARVTHPGVLTIIDVGATPQGSSFMVSEHLSGLDLLAYLRRFGALRTDRVVQMGCRIAEALEATHAQGVIHRDVKPSNVFLLGAFEPLGPEWDAVKLIDFGLSRFESRNDELSKSGIVMGTPAYMAPEQARGARTDHLTDVYGVGAVLYAAATGVPPFREENQQQTLIAAMSRDPVRPREINPAISEALEVVIQRAMSKRPEERHPSMSALRLALSNLERGTRSPQIGAQAPAPKRGHGSVRLRFLALGGTALGVAVLAISSAVTGITLLSLDELAPTSSEAALWTVVLAATVGLLLLWLQRMVKSIWSNSAKVLDRLPHLRAPLIGGLVVYGFCSLLLRVAREVVPRFVEGTAFDGYPDLAWPGWSVLLSLAALAAAVGVAVHDRYWQPMSLRQRWVWGPLAGASAAVVLLSLARPDLLARSLASWVPSASLGGAGSAADHVAPTTGLGSMGSATALVVGVTRDAGVPAGDESAPIAEGSAGLGVIPVPISSPDGASHDVVDAGLGAVATAERVDTERAPQAPNAPASLPPPVSVMPPANLPSPASLLPPADLPPPASLLPPPSSPAPAISVPPVSSPPATTPTPPASSPSRSISPPPSIAPPRMGGDRTETLKARAIAQSEQPAELVEAVRTLAQLLKIAPDRANDPAVRRILTKAAAAEGDASREAFRVMGEGMGRRGPDLLYELMLEEPALAERAKHTLSRFRVRRHFSPQLSIAWDLRFSTNCGSRYSLLDRANQIGDQRSIDTLSALLGKPEKCGTDGTLPCLPRCMKEAIGFTRAIEQIARRLRAGEREAKAN